MDLRVILLGPPGSGKGTQAARMAARFGIAHVSSGDLLRRHVAEGTGFGRAVSGYLARGDLVPDEVVLAMLQEQVVEAARAGGYVLDGFPRTLAQAEAAYRVAEELGVTAHAAVSLEVPTDELVRRLLARGLEQGRSDDTEATVRHRLAVFENQTRPVLDHYERRGLLARVDGSLPADDVTAAVLAVLERVATA